ncbi:MAG TPA: S1 RNA-binding domain-containing protein, partial [Pyrinomonadaceae bacterium]
MSTENETPTNGENTSEQPAPAASSESGERGETAASAATATASAEQTATAPSPAAEAPTAQPAEAPAQPAEAPAAPQASAAAAGGDDDDDEDEGGRGGGGGESFDFGAMLDQYEQEQAQYQEGSVVRGTVVGVTERSVVIDFGFKSEGAVPIEEFQEAGELTVKRGDEVEVLIKSMESSEGVPILSRADAVRMRAWDELERAYREGTPVKGRIAE